MSRLSKQAAGSVILGLSRGKGLSARVRHALEGRRGIPTLLHYSLLDAVGGVLAQGVVTIEPDTDKYVDRTLVELPVKAVLEHDIWGAMLETGQVVAMRWRIELRDVSGDVLARKTYSCEYCAPWQV
jgi:hypothetical protein